MVEFQPIKKNMRPLNGIAFSPGIRGEHKQKSVKAPHISLISLVFRRIQVDEILKKKMVVKKTHATLYEFLKEKPLMDSLVFRVLPTTQVTGKEGKERRVSFNKLFLLN